MTIEVALIIHKQTEIKKQSKIKNRIKNHNNNNHSNNNNKGKTEEKQNAIHKYHTQIYTQSQTNYSV